MKSLLVAGVALSFCLAAPAQNSPGYLAMDRALAPGGTVVLQMNVGNVKILPGRGPGVRLEMQSDQGTDPGTMASWVRRFDVGANRATIEIQVPRDHEHCSDCSQGFEVTIYVPARTDLKVSLGVGNLSIHGITGDKDADVNVGNLTLGYASAGEFGHVETHTRIGDIDDPLHRGDASGFLGKDEDFSLTGRYHLKASVGVGNVKLVEDGH